MIAAPSPTDERTADGEHPATGALDPQRATVHREIAEGDDDPGRLDVLHDAHVTADERVDESVAHQHLPARGNRLIGAPNGARRDGDADHDGRGTDDADECPSQPSIHLAHLRPPDADTAR